MATDRSASERFIEVPRTARYWVEGSAKGARDVWFLLHGYGQLARDVLRAARPLAGAGRLVVAPEALSRFYPRAGGGHSGSAVGASWMTREDREHEVADYVRYLDAVCAEVLAALAPRPRIHLLGFSQGAATAARWAGCGEVRPATLVLWERHRRWIWRGRRGAGWPASGSGWYTVPPTAWSIPRHSRPAPPGSGRTGLWSPSNRSRGGTASTTRC